MQSEKVELSDGRIARVGPMKAGRMFEFMELDQDDVPGIIRFLARTATVDDKPAYADAEALDDAPFIEVKAVADAAMRVNGMTEASAALLGEG